MFGANKRMCVCVCRASCISTLSPIATEAQCFCVCFISQSYPPPRLVSLNDGGKTHYLVGERDEGEDAEEGEDLLTVTQTSTTLSGAFFFWALTGII